MRTLRIGTFSPSVVLGVAAATGALDTAGLAITQGPARNSPEQFAALLAGELDAAITSPDNVLAYRFVADNPLGHTGDLRVPLARIRLTVLRTRSHRASANAHIIRAGFADARA